MIGVVLVTHSKLAFELIAALEYIVGPQDKMVGVCIGPEDDIEKRREEIFTYIRDLDEGNGVVVLTDMFGGTPSNLAISILGKANIEVIAGVNLPMLIRLSSSRKTEPLRKLVQSAKSAGRKYINIASQILDGPQV